MTAVPFLFILTFASPKGGVGKSTSCLAIAGALAAHGYPVHIVDLDQIQTLWAWYKEHQPAIPNLSVEAAPPQPDGISFLRYLKSVCDNRRGFVLVDAAGALTDIMVYAAAIAHLTTPTPFPAPCGANTIMLASGDGCRRNRPLHLPMNSPFPPRSPAAVSSPIVTKRAAP